MSQRATPTPMVDLEEAAQGHQLFRAPGDQLHREQAADQADAAGWLDPDVVYDWPAADERRRIVDRRQDFYDAMRRLELSAALPTGRDDWCQQVDAALAGLQQELVRHISEIEAADGLFVDIIERTPRLTSQVEDLRAEHVELTEACQGALEAITAKAPVSEIRRRVVGILGRLVVHRQDGAELLYESYNVDVSAGD